VNKLRAYYRLSLCGCSLSVRLSDGSDLWLMKQLRRAGVCQDDLLYYYEAVVRPVLEYASPCWQTRLTKEQTKQREHVQRRALQVIFGNIPSHCSLSFLPRGKKERLQWEGMLPKMTRRARR